MHACADESAGAREERPSKRSTPTESELADAPVLSDSDLMPPEMEGQLSEEAGNLPPPLRTSLGGVQVFPLQEGWDGILDT